MNAVDTPALIVFNSGACFRADSWAVVDKTLTASGHFVGKSDRKTTLSWPQAIVAEIRWGSAPDGRRP
jgi:hypothetical protein